MAELGKTTDIDGETDNELGVPYKVAMNLSFPEVVDGITLPT